MLVKELMIGVLEMEREAQAEVEMRWVVGVSLGHWKSWH